MCSFKDVEQKRSIYTRARHFYITRPWGMNISPMKLASLFEVANPEHSSDFINIGSFVDLFDLQDRQVCKLQVVAPQDSLPEAGKISFLSPLGAALMDARPGDTVSISALRQSMKFKIIRVI